MSWSFDNVGTPELVNAAIDEAVANPHGMPAVVGDYLKGAVAACAPSGDVAALVRVVSSGHRPMAGPGSREMAEVQLLQNGPRKR